MKKSKYRFMGLLIGSVCLGMLNSCGLEKRVIVTTRGHEASFPHKQYIPRCELLQEYDTFPRDTVMNYKIK